MRVPAGRYAELDARVLEVLREHDQTTPAAIGQVVGLDRFGVQRSLSRLHNRGLARVVRMSDTPRSWGTHSPEAVWEAVPPE